MLVIGGLGRLGGLGRAGKVGRVGTGGSACRTGRDVSHVGLVVQV